MMKKRDLEIIRTLEQFRALSRDQIAHMFFSHTKNPITNANYVMKRLRRDRQIEVNTSRQPFIYFPSPSRIKKDGKKVDHFLEIADFYTQLLPYENPRCFDIEMDHTSVRPDIFMIWKKAPFWVEIQRSTYSNNVMRDKLKRYEELYYSDLWQDFDWQGKHPIFPRIWIVTTTKYDIPRSLPFKVIQTSNVNELLKMTQNPRNNDDKTIRVSVG